MLTRNQEQEKIMMIIYAALFYQKLGSPVEITQLVEDITEQGYNEAPLFIKEVSIKALVHQIEIVQLIKDNLVDWKFDRLNLVTQAILIHAVTLGKYIEDEDLVKPIIIDTAVNLAKKYSDDFRFVNGILDKII